MSWLPVIAAGLLESGFAVFLKLSHGLGTDTYVLP